VIIQQDKRFCREFEKLSTVDQARIRDALKKIVSVFGEPHRHAGLGLRKLGRDVYEVRVGLELRILMTRHKAVLLLRTIGNHDEISRFLRDLL